MSVAFDVLRAINRGAVEVVGQLGYLFLFGVPAFFAHRFYKFLERNSDSALRNLQRYDKRPDSYWIDHQRRSDKANQRLTAVFYVVVQIFFLWAFFNGHAILGVMSRSSD